MRNSLVFYPIKENLDKTTKDEAWDVLFMLNEFGLIELVPFNGMMLKY